MAMPWYNWQQITIRQIKSELRFLRFVEYAPAKTGYWFRYSIYWFHTKYQPKFFVRVIPYDWAILIRICASNCDRTHIDRNI